ncbi:MAG: PorT family protein [Saprospiraceae bacterium]|nr:PorT family protein [Saprospiraceae bacterium]
MSKLRFVYLLSLVLPIDCIGQVNFFVSGGLHSVDVQAEDFLIIDKDKRDSFGLSLEKASYGYHFGAGVRLRFGAFFFQPELIFNSNKAEYKFNDFSVPSLVDSIKTERYQYLDLPLLFGVKAGLVRLYAGPVGHFFLANTSELFDIDGYDDKFRAATFGYQAGLGFDISFIGIDIRHEGNFSAFGEHVRFFGERIHFDHRASRLLGTISIKF